MALGRRQLFFYWRLAPADVPAARFALCELGTRLKSDHPALHTRWFVRVDGAHATLMECYGVDGDAAGIDAALQRALQQQGDQAVGRWLVGSRHLEVFDALDG